MEPKFKKSTQQFFSFFPFVNSVSQRFWCLLTSIRLTVLYLSMLFFLVAVGTFYQIDYGLYAAQERFFYSWIIVFFNFIPFPGGQMIMWLISISIFCNSFKHFKWRLKKMGILFLHFGILFLLMGAFFIHYFAEESFLSLQEGEIKNTSESYHRWEIAFWQKKDSPTKQIQAYTVDKSDIGKSFNFTLPFTLANENDDPNNRSNRRSTQQFVITINDYYLNSTLLENNRIYNKRLEKEVEKNQPAVFLSYPNLTNNHPTQQMKSLALIGNFSPPFLLKINQQEFFFSFRRQHFVFPFQLGLIDFKKENYYQTDTPKSYQSLVEVKQSQTDSRQTRIYMNNPLRLHDYTFYQSSFLSDSRTGNETSILAVVKNKFRLFPYFASTIVAIGLLLHFTSMFFWRLKKN